MKIAVYYLTYVFKAVIERSPNNLNTKDNFISLKQ